MVCAKPVFIVWWQISILGYAKLSTHTPYTEVCCVCFKQRTGKCLSLLDNQLLLILLETEFPWESRVGFASSKA